MMIDEKLERLTPEQRAKVEVLRERLHVLECERQHRRAQELLSRPNVGATPSLFPKGYSLKGAF